MTNTQSNDLFQQLALRWEQAIAERRNEDVIVDGLLGFIAFRDRKDQSFARASLIYVRQAIDNLFRESDDAHAGPEQAPPACSFCGRPELPNRLIAGPNAFICNSCAATAHEALNLKDRA